MPNIPVVERTCKERHTHLEDKILELKDEITKLRIAWIGNGKIGYVEKLNRMWEIYETNKQRYNGIINWSYRATIGGMIAWVIKLLTDVLSKLTL